MSVMLYGCIGIFIGGTVGYLISKDVDMDQALDVGIMSVLSTIFWPVAVFILFCSLIGIIIISIFNRD